MNENVHKTQNKAGVGPEIPKKMDPRLNQLRALAPIFQKWSEVADRNADLDPAPAFRWYLKGMAQAFELCAAHIRELSSPTVEVMPPEDLAKLSDAFDVVFSMIRAMSNNNHTTEEGPPDGEPSEPASDLQSRAAKLD